jgi:predicted DCC family thiol-disulfide oxidoreductase YuxK
MTRRAEVTALTREGQKILMAAVFASDPGKAVMEDAAIEVTVNDHFDIRTKKAILFGKTVVIDLFKSLKMILHTLKILRFPWLSRAIYRRDVGHDRFSIGNKSRMPDEMYCKLN